MKRFFYLYYKGWNGKCGIECIDTAIYCLDEDYEPKPETHYKELDKEREEMNEKEIIEYLKQNKEKGIAFNFMPEEVKNWCKSNNADLMVYDDDWSTFDWFDKRHVYCLPEDYKPKQRLKPDWEEFKIDEDGYFEFNGKKYYYREDSRFETENRDKFKGFGGWLCLDGNWRTYPALYRETNDTVCYNGSCDCECEPAVVIKIRFWRR